MRRSSTNRIIFHHSLADRSTAVMIDSWHKAKGWEKIGYHKVILRDGTVEDGRDIRDIGAHSYGRNKDSVGICFEGDFWKYEPTTQQIESAIIIFHNVCRLYSKPLKIEFHRPWLMMNACPGRKFNRKDFLEILIRNCPYDYYEKG